MSTDGFAAPESGRFETGRPYEGPELATALGALHDESLDYLATLSDEEFLAPQGAAWSPAQHVRHLRRSCRPVADALGAPKVLLGARFGRARRPSRAYGGVVESYHEALRAGGSADGTVYDAPTVEAEGDVEAWRHGFVDRWSDTVRAVQSRLDRWSESALDKYQLPHPLLGEMTVREILLFTLYHNAHHLRRIDERRGG